MTRIMVVDDHEIVRDALAELIGSYPGLEVVGVASSLRTAAPLMEKLHPDVVLADLSLDDGSGWELVRVARQAKLTTRVLIVTSFRDTFAAREALKGGVAGYVLKMQPTSDLIAAISAVMAGERYVSPAVALSNPEAPPEAAAGIGTLSRRESEIFRLVVGGLSSKEIARRLCISVKTVETHRSNIYRKVAVRRTSDLIRFAVAQGISVAPTQPAANGETPAPTI